MSRARDRADGDFAGKELIFDADGDTSITADTDDQIDIRVAGSDQIKIATSEVAFNEASGDIDFRVEGNGDANALFVEGESDNVGIGNNDPLVKLDVIGSNSPAATSGTSQNGSLRLGQSSGNGVVDMGFDTTNTIGWIQATNKANLGTNYTLNLNPNGGDVKIGAGDIFFGGSGKGINLGVTSNTDSNTLDDYEEGTWTPAQAVGGNSSISASEATYTKIGRTVYAHCSVSFSGTDTDRVRITGLPFAVSNTAAAATFFSGSPSDNASFIIQTLSSSHEFSGGNGTDMTYANVQNTTFRISGTYITTA